MEISVNEAMLRDGGSEGTRHFSLLQRILVKSSWRIENLGKMLEAYPASLKNKVL